MYIAPYGDWSRPPPPVESTVEFAEKCFDNFDFDINACGVPCPGPIMKLAKKIKEMEDGQVVRVTASAKVERSQHAVTPGAGAGGAASPSAGDGSSGSGLGSGSSAGFASGSSRERRAARVA